jgi:beta-lactam-binding protein with PASTA domain
MVPVKPKLLERVDAKKSLFARLWFVPFLGFLLGYIIASYFLHKNDLATPNVVGKSLHEGIHILSDFHLGLRLLQQREDNSLPEGTIIDQLPRPLQRIRPNQNVFVTISVKPRNILMPDLWGKRQKEACEIASKLGLDTKEVLLRTTYPEGMCIAQFPPMAQELGNKKVTLYFSEGKSTLYVMPNLKGKLLADIDKALQQYDVRAEVFHDQPIAPEHTCVNCKIIDQQPVTGAIVDMKHGLQVQLKVSTV